MLKVIPPLFKAVDYSQQFLIVGIIPNFRPLEFSIIEYYWSLVELGSVRILIRAKFNTLVIIING